MGKRANPAWIGAFVLFAIVICAAAVVIVGSGRLFRNTRTFVIFFPGSVNGLDRGAPVKFRGVPIGTVTDIRIRMRELAATGRIPVLIEVDRERVHELGGQDDSLDDRRLNELIHDLGMRAQLQQQSSHGGGGGAKTGAAPDTRLLAQRIIKNAFNFLAGFAGNTANGVEVVPLKSFQDWWTKFERRVQNDPGFLERDED